MTDNNDDNDNENNVFFSIEDIYNKDKYITEIDDSISDMTTNPDTPSFLNLSTDGYLYNNLCRAIGENEYDDFDPNEMFNLSYFKKQEVYGVNKYSYYENEYTVKDLMKICEYYKIDKDIKNLKCKKCDIISTIILFESLAENQNIVRRRHQMWGHIDALIKDSIMRKYIIWN